MVNIVWAIDWMNTSTQTINGFSEVVVTAGWRCTGTDNSTGQNYTASNYGSVSFVEPPAGDPNFVPYAQLTQPIVLGWVWANGVNQAQVEASVAAQVNTLVNPPYAQLPLPWAASASK